MILRRVRGRSMEPALHPGALVVGVAREARTGDIVVARNPGGKEIVKRVASVQNGKYQLVGDNRLYSTDSREFGPVPKSAILSVIVMKIQFPKATDAPKVKNTRLLVFPYVAAAALLVILLTQLVTFEKFVPSLDMVVPHWGGFWAFVITFSEVFALPYLLRMRMSPLARVSSLLLGYFVIFVWMLLLNISLNGIVDLPLLGGVAYPTITVSMAILMVLFAFIGVSHTVLTDGLQKKASSRPRRVMHKITKRLKKSA